MSKLILLYIAVFSFPLQAFCPEYFYSKGYVEGILDIDKHFPTY